MTNGQATLKALRFVTACAEMVEDKTLSDEQMADRITILAQQHTPRELYDILTALSEYTIRLRDSLFGEG